MLAWWGTSWSSSFEKLKLYVNRVDAVYELLYEQSTDRYHVERNTPVYRSTRNVYRDIAADPKNKSIYLLEKQTFSHSYVTLLRKNQSNQFIYVNSLKLGHDSFSMDLAYLDDSSDPCLITKDLDHFHCSVVSPNKVSELSFEISNEKENLESMGDIVQVDSHHFLSTEKKIIGGFTSTLLRIYRYEPEREVFVMEKEYDLKKEFQISASSNFYVPGVMIHVVKNQLTNLPTHRLLLITHSGLMYISSLLFDKSGDLSSIRFDPKIKQHTGLYDCQGATSEIVCPFCHLE
ncbi:MAG: hypothetical protein R3A11_00555 [Bdellovibrionota bacterium]